MRKELINCVLFLRFFPERGYLIIADVDHTGTQPSGMKDCVHTHTGRSWLFTPAQPQARVPSLTSKASVLLPAPKVSVVTGPCHPRQVWMLDPSGQQPRDPTHLRHLFPVDWHAGSHVVTAKAAHWRFRSPA